jgi:hypothetical protein
MPFDVGPCLGSTTSVCVLMCCRPPPPFPLIPSAANFDGRVWMRAAAAAERFWSPMGERDVLAAQQRLRDLRGQMVRASLYGIEQFIFAAHYNFFPNASKTPTPTQPDCTPPFLARRRSLVSSRRPWPLSTAMRPTVPWGPTPATRDTPPSSHRPSPTATGERQHGEKGMGVKHACDG